jgi:hypothetical protein
MGCIKVLAYKFCGVLGVPFQKRSKSNSWENLSSESLKWSSPILEQSCEAFRRDFEDLKQSNLYDWVAYSGDRRLGIDKSKTKLYMQCLNAGLSEDEFIVFHITPEPACLFNNIEVF